MGHETGLKPLLVQRLFTGSHLADAVRGTGRGFRDDLIAVVVLATVTSASREIMRMQPGCLPPLLFSEVHHV